MNPEYGMFTALAVAILGGAAVGVERQRSGHASGPHARLGGIRTFTLLGTVGGIAGLVTADGYALTAAVLEAGALALIVVGYFRASKIDIDATTEVAALAVLGAGTLSGLGYPSTSAALTTITVLLLAEKTRLHRLVRRLDEVTMLAAARFAVMSVVILPLLPVGPFGPAPGVRPRELWMVVLLFSGMSFLGLVAQRTVGAAGYPLTGLIGGLVSSTSVTLTFARLSQKHKALAAPLATGAVAASTILFLRVTAAVAVLNAAMVPTLAWYLATPFLAAAIGLAIAWRSMRGDPVTVAEQKNPLQFRAALEMAALFQVVLFAVHFVRLWLGESGLMAGGFVLGLTDVDALTLSMTRITSTGASIDIACRAILVGVIANSLMKAAIALAIGERRFAWQTAVPLAAMAAAGGAMLLLK
ncbi:MAG: MgtC/SapB family protein [Vicinamibacterales bacterium]